MTPHETYTQALREAAAALYRATAELAALMARAAGTATGTTELLPTPITCLRTFRALYLVESILDEPRSGWSSLPAEAHPQNVVKALEARAHRRADPHDHVHRPMPTVPSPANAWFGVKRELLAFLDVIGADRGPDGTFIIRSSIPTFLGADDPDAEVAISGDAEYFVAGKARSLADGLTSSGDLASVSSTPGSHVVSS